MRALDRSECRGEDVHARDRLGRTFLDVEMRLWAVKVLFHRKAGKSESGQRFLSHN